MTEPIRVLLIDDHQLCRRGLGDLLESLAGMKVVASTGDAQELLALLRSEQPDLLVTDLKMEPVDGHRLVRAVHEAGIELPIVILTMSDSREDLAQALRMGVRGYLLKDMPAADIVDSIARAARGELVVAPAMADKLSSLLRDGLQEPESQQASLQSLTARQREILDYVARGMSNKAIARELGISQDTVKLHVRHILSKLNLRSRVEAAVYAVEHRAETQGAEARDPGAVLGA